MFLALYCHQNRKVPAHIPPLAVSMHMCMHKLVMQVVFRPSKKHGGASRTVYPSLMQYCVCSGPTVFLRFLWKYRTDALNWNICTQAPGRRTKCTLIVVDCCCHFPEAGSNIFTAPCFWYVESFLLPIPYMFLGHLRTSCFQFHLFSVFLDGYGHKDTACRFKQTCVWCFKTKSICVTMERLDIIQFLFS